MSARPVIEVESLSKRYRLGGRRNRYPTLRDAVAGAGTRLVRRRGDGVPPREVWALREVSFAVRAGEVVGVIGPNGAGKTSLLKILSRITEPTSGWAEVEGRVGSLLEVGTGFHFELTGRENIFLSGAILGMRRAEIRRRFDEIVAFAEVEEFLDTPVKHYSSGMRVRLAFAVAAHLEPEILLVDEVLAVGDAAFQRKSLGKMDEVAGTGRTVLFVSHNMALIQTLCTRGVYIERGRVRADGNVDEAIGAYLRGLEHATADDLAHRTDRRGWQEIRLERIEVLGPDAHPASLTTGREARFVFHLTGVQSRLRCEVTILDHLGHPVATLSSAASGPDDVYDLPEPRIDCVVDEVPLVPGRYRLDVSVHGGGQVQDRVDGAAFFNVEGGVLGGRPVARDRGPGSVAIRHRWSLPQGGF